MAARLDDSEKGAYVLQSEHRNKQCELIHALQSLRKGYKLMRSFNMGADI